MLSNKNNPVKKCLLFFLFVLFLICSEMHQIVKRFYLYILLIFFTHTHTHTGFDPMSCHSEELWCNETVCLWIPIYILPIRVEHSREEITGCHLHNAKLFSWIEHTVAVKNIHIKQNKSDTYALKSLPPPLCWVVWRLCVRISDWRKVSKVSIPVLSFSRI